jgi:hypothetical protein
VLAIFFAPNTVDGAFQPHRRRPEPRQRRLVAHAADRAAWHLGRRRALITAQHRRFPVDRRLQAFVLSVLIMLGFKFRAATTREWILYLTGGLSVLFGVLVVVRPRSARLIAHDCAWAIIIGHSRSCSRCVCAAWRTV